MLQNTNKELKTLIYNASKIVCGDNLHIIMEKEERKHFEILEHTN